MKIAIVTDSTSDLPPELAEHHHISVVPAILILNGQQYLDGESITREEYYDQLPGLTPPPTTAAPSSGMFDQLYKKLFAAGYEQICSIHAASKLSGIYTAARVAAEGFGDRIRVVDSGQISLGLGFQALEAARTAMGGSLGAVLETIESVQRRLRVVAMLDTLDQLKRSGRVSWVRHGIGSLLRIKLFLEVKQGDVLRLGETRTRSKGTERLAEILAECGPLEQLAILHTNALTEAEQLAARFASLVPAPPMIRNVTTVIGTHVGVRGLGFALVQAQSAA